MHCHLLDNSKVAQDSIWVFYMETPCEMYVA